MRVIKRCVQIFLSIMISLTASFSLQAKDQGPLIAYGEKSLIQSKIMGDERPLQIYLPDSYHMTTKKYPVIYVLDGEFLFEPAVTISKIRAARNLMPESIIVGLPNTGGAMRMDMGLPMKNTPDAKQVFFEKGRYRQMVNFLETELVPMIDGQYRTAKHRMLVGMSPTAGPVLHSYLQGNNIFSAHVAFAAEVDFYQTDGAFIADQLAQKAKENQNQQSWLYIGRAKSDMGDKAGRADAFKKLQAEFLSLTGQAKAVVDIVGQSEHYASAIEGFTGAFSLVYPREIWVPDYKAVQQSDKSADMMTAFYENLSEYYGIDTYPIEKGFWLGNSLSGLTRFLLGQGKFDDVLRLATWGLTIYPNSYELYYRKAVAHEAKGQLKKAFEAVQKSYDRSVAQKGAFTAFLKQERARLKQAAAKQ